MSESTQSAPTNGRHLSPARPRDSPSSEPSYDSNGEGMSTYEAPWEREISNAVESELDTFRQVPIKLKQKLNETKEELAVRFAASKDELQGRWRRTVTGDSKKRIRDHIKEAPQVKLRDKFAFTFGIVVMMVTEAIVLVVPEYFRLWYTVIIPTLVMIRYPMYARSKWQYFLIDFCYFADLLCLVQVWIFPTNQTIFMLAFVMANGPLAWAIIAWRNSLVFHSLDKVTSVFIHAFPPLLTYCQRWFVTPYSVDCTASECHWTLVSGMLLPLIGYLAWQAFYYYKTEVLDRAKLDADPKIETSLRWLSRSEGGMQKAVRNLMRKIGVMAPKENFDSKTMKTKMIFMGAQLAFTIFTFAPTYLWYNSFWAHSGFLAFVFLVCIYNGACYYIEVFAATYAKKFATAVLKDEPLVTAVSGDDGSVTVVTVTPKVEVQTTIEEPKGVMEMEKGKVEEAKSA